MTTPENMEENKEQLNEVKSAPESADPRVEAIWSEIEKDVNEVVEGQKMSKEDIIQAISLANNIHDLLHNHENQQVVYENFEDLNNCAIMRKVQQYWNRIPATVQSIIFNYPIPVYPPTETIKVLINHGLLDYPEEAIMKKQNRNSLVKNAIKAVGGALSKEFTLYLRIFRPVEEVTDTLYEYRDELRRHLVEQRRKRENPAEEDLMLAA